MNFRAWSSFKRTWQHQTSMQLATLSVLVGTFTVLCLAILIHQNVFNFISHWGDQLKVSIYLNDGVSQDQLGDIKKFVSENSLFQNSEYKTKKMAAEEFKKRISQFAPGLVSEIENDNPLPASLEATVAGGLDSQNKFKLILQALEEIKKMTGVDEVSYGQGWVENYATLLRVFSVTSILIVTMLLCGALFVIGNSIRNSVSQRRDEIELLELFGATKSDIIWPYVFEGLIMGLGSAILSVLITYVGFAWQHDLLMNELSFWKPGVDMQFLSAERIQIIIAFGTILGGVGSFLWVRKVNTGWAASEANN